MPTEASPAAGASHGGSGASFAKRFPSLDSRKTREDSHLLWETHPSRPDPSPLSSCPSGPSLGAPLALAPATHACPCQPACCIYRHVTAHIHRCFLKTGLESSTLFVSHCIDKRTLSPPNKNSLNG